VRGRTRYRVAWVLAGLVLVTGGLVAQRRRPDPEILPNAAYDGRFTFVRIRYSARMDGRFRGFGDPKWNHDYPRAEFHFGKILDEVSLIATYLEGGNVLTLDDPELFRFPVAYLTEPGYWVPNDAEVEGMRAYLMKGGFMIFDDFAGGEWYNFQDQLLRVLPGARLIRLDVTHPVFDTFFRIESLELAHPYRAYWSEFYGVFEDNDPDRRLMVIVNYNNDIAEYWEWSDTDFAPIELTNEAYKLGVNYVVYAMTH